MNKPPSFPFYPKDWMDFKVQRMSYEAQGIYMNILCFMWKDSRDQCSILDDDKSIARSLGISIRKWQSIKKEIQFTGDPLFMKKRNKLVSKKLKKISTELKEYRKKQAEKGRKSAESRRTTVEPRLNRGSTTAQPEGNSSSSSSSSKGNTKVFPKNKGFTIPEWLPLEEFNEYKAMRKKIRKPMTDRAEELVIKKLEKLKNEGHDPKEVLEQSILNSWQGLYPIKEERGNYKTSQIGKSNYKPSEDEKARKEILEAYRKELRKKYEPEILKAEKAKDEDRLNAIELEIKEGVAQKSQEI